MSLLPRELAALLVTALLVASGCAPNTTPKPPATQIGTYLASDDRSSHFPTERVPFSLAPSVLWSARAPGSISAQPLLSGKVVYWGAWDGYERATTTAGKQLWVTDLGRSSDAACEPPAAGVAGTPTLAVLGGEPVLYLAGGSARFFALNARTGSIIWKTVLGSAPAEFIWGSPALYRGSLYVGVSAFGECAPSSGRLVELDAATGAVLHVFSTVPKGCSGGGIWGSPTVDDATGTVFVATGDSDAADCTRPAPYAQALVALRAKDLSLLDAWQVPPPERVSDGDFGSTPTLFTSNSGGANRPLVGVANKNGTYYAFDRNRIGRGPIWRSVIAKGGSCPYCGDGSIASSAFDGARLFVAGGTTRIAGAACPGGLRALDPATGAPTWGLCLTSGPVLAGVVSVPGLVLVGSGPDLVGVASDTGQIVFKFAAPDRAAAFLAPAWPSDGIVYAGTSGGDLYALGRATP